MKYLFSDTDIAARRLGLIAEVFAPLTRTLLCNATTSSPRLAVDLGCGPGYSTHLLAEALRCDHAVGLDNSEYFIGLAKETTTPQVSFCLHDVTQTPFPVGSADLLYCKLLLTHLSDPQAAVAAWATQLVSGGLLVMEEVEWIHTDSAVFSKYMSIVEAMLADNDSNLYVGEALDRIETGCAFQRRSSQVRGFPVPSHRAAQMFSMNIQSWKHQPFVRANYSAEDISRLEQGLAEMASEASAAAHIEWGFRHMVLERT
jgi:SAM-dependent methyltransferase